MLGGQLQDGSGRLRPLPLLLSCLLRQMQRLLPLAAATYSVTVVRREHPHALLGVSRLPARW